MKQQVFNKTQQEKAVYSSMDADLLNYRQGLIAFYETGDYSPYVDYCLNKQVERIKEIE